MVCPLNLYYSLTPNGGGGQVPNFFISQFATPLNMRNTQKLVCMFFNPSYKRVWSRYTQLVVEKVLEPFPVRWSMTQNHVNGSMFLIWRHNVELSSLLGDLR